MVQPLDIRPNIKRALEAKRPLVALESAMISHGLPYPDNLETALAMELAVRQAGAVPATIGVVDGGVRIGLPGSELALFAQSADVRKASLRDLAIICAGGQHGATTVAATAACAHRAGISVFATGGIGGVHRGGETTLDVSADLLALSRTPIAVVCSGAKSILDLPRTLEVLETLGVPILGYGTDFFPAFYTRSSGLPVDQRVDSAAEAAAIIDAQFRLGLGRLGLASGIVVAQPLPRHAALDTAEIEACLGQALDEATALGVQGKAVTPFLLRRMAEMTDGRSLVANITLLRENARLAAEIAAEITITGGDLIRDGTPSG